MGVKLVERFFEKMPEGNDYQNETKRYERITSSPPDDHQQPGDQFDYRNDGSYNPERPRRQEAARIRLYEIVTRVTERAQLKDLVNAGHKENESQDSAREEERPRAVLINDGL